MVETLLHWLETLNPFWVHVVNFLLLVLEGIGIPGVPFEASMLSLGLLVHAGQTHLWEAVLYGALGNTLGNVIGYYIGPRGLRLIPEDVQHRFGLKKIQEMLEQRGAWMAVISRWFGPFRTLFILYAREAGLGIGPYAFCSFIGALSWTAVWQIGMWAGGVAFVELWHRYQTYALIVIAVLAVPGYFIYKAIKKRQEAREVREEIQ